MSNEEGMIVDKEIAARKHKKAVPFLIGLSARFLFKYSLWL